MKKRGNDKRSINMLKMEGFKYGKNHIIYNKMSDQTHCKVCGKPIGLNEGTKYNNLCENCITRRRQKQRNRGGHWGEGIIEFFFWGIAMMIFLFETYEFHWAINVLIGVITGLFCGWLGYYFGFASCCKIIKNEDT